jgi:hypothetical protein
MSVSCDCRALRIACRSHAAMNNVSHPRAQPGSAQVGKVWVISQLTVRQRQARQCGAHWRVAILTATLRLCYDGGSPEFRFFPAFFYILEGGPQTRHPRGHVQLHIHIAPQSRTAQQQQHGPGDRVPQDPRPGRAAAHDLLLQIPAIHERKSLP